MPDGQLCVTHVSSLKAVEIFNKHPSCNISIPNDKCPKYTKIYTAKDN